MSTPSNHASRRAPHGVASRGFSLAEMLVVMTIATALATVTVPRFANFMASRNVDAAARRLATDLAAARQRARTLSTSVTVTFDTSKHRYSIAGMPDPDHQANGYTVSLARDPYRATLPLADFSGAATCTFNRFGLPISGGTAVVSAAGRTKHITVSAATGEVTVGNGSGGHAQIEGGGEEPDIIIEGQPPAGGLDVY